MMGGSPGHVFRTMAMKVWIQACTWMMKLLSYDFVVLINSRPFCRLYFGPHLDPKLFSIFPGRSWREMSVRRPGPLYNA